MGLSHESEILFFFWKCPLITLLSWPHSPITLSISKMSQVVYTQLDTYPFLPFYREEHDDRLALGLAAECDCHENNVCQGTCSASLLIGRYKDNQRPNDQKFQRLARWIFPGGAEAISYQMQT